MGDAFAVQEFQAHSSCSMCEPGAIHWIDIYLHDCVNGPRDIAGFTLGIVSICFWVVAQVRATCVTNSQAGFDVLFGAMLMSHHLASATYCWCCQRVQASCHRCTNDLVRITKAPAFGACAGSPVHTEHQTGECGGALKLVFGSVASG